MSAAQNLTRTSADLRCILSVCSERSAGKRSSRTCKSESSAKCYSASVRACATINSMSRVNAVQQYVSDMRRVSATHSLGSAAPDDM